MEKQFEMMVITRRNVLDLLDTCTEEELFRIPNPFNNHLLWNTLHLLSAQQVLFYRFTGNSYRLSEDFVEEYGKGSVPTEKVYPELITFAKEHIISSAVQSREDYANGVFGNDYQSVVTSYGVTLNSIEDAISYLNIHEGMHLGQMKMLKKML